MAHIQVTNDNEFSMLLDTLSSDIVLAHVHYTLFRDLQKSVETYWKVFTETFDDFWGEYKAGYFEQIDQHLADNPVPGLEIVFHNQRTCFHVSVAMRHAAVINEPG